MILINAAELRKLMTGGTIYAHGYIVKFITGVIVLKSAGRGYTVCILDQPGQVKLSRHAAALSHAGK